MAGILHRASQSLGSFSSSIVHRRDHPTSADAYELLEECGRGVSATVYRALCKPLNEIVAVKLMNLETVNCSLDDIVKEAQTMRLLNHPNVLALYVSFVHKENLWMIEPYISGGSMLNVMKYAHPDGLPEAIIAVVLRDVLKGLDYMHRHDNIHRDVKAGNILVNDDGSVLLADFGVAATLERSTSWGFAAGGRNTFVGTPCWMAPEVMEQAQGYNALADIWSFGITMLELAHGHAPFARFAPMKVLLMTIQNPPPTLDQDSGTKHFSKHMRDAVQLCLQKDPSKRPSAAKLLEHKFFKGAGDRDRLVKSLLSSLPPVYKRVEEMRAGRAPGHSSKQAQAQVAESQEAYVKGVSNWNFDVANLKKQADLEHLEPVPEVPLEREYEQNGEGRNRSPPSPGALSPSPRAQPTKRPSRFEVSRDESPAIGDGRAVPMASLPDMGPLHISTSTGDSLKESVTRSSSMASMDDSAKPAQRKGRFNIVANDSDAASKRLARGNSISNFADKSAVPTATALLPSLKDCLEGMTAQQEMVKQLVAALEDVGRGRASGLTNLLTEFSEHAAGRPSREDHARIKAELAAAKDEILRLKERMKHLEGPATPTH